MARKRIAVQSHSLPCPARTPASHHKPDHPDRRIAYYQSQYIGADLHQHFVSVEALPLPRLPGMPPERTGPMPQEIDGGLARPVSAHHSSIFLRNVSGRNRIPITAVIPAMSTGYHRP